MLPSTIGEWSPEQLRRFIETTLLQVTTSSPPSVQARNVRATEKLAVEGELTLSPRAIAYLKTLGL